MACRWLRIAMTGVAALALIGCSSTVPGRLTSLAGRHAAARNATGVRPCSPDRLAAHAQFDAAGAGNDAYDITISDHGAPCSLTGRPSFLIGVRASGHQVRLHPSGLSTDYTTAMTTRRPARLTTSNPAEVVLVTTVGCPAGQRARTGRDTYTTLRLGIGSASLPVGLTAGPEPRDDNFWLPCGVAMSNFYAAP